MKKQKVKKKVWIKQKQEDQNEEQESLLEKGENKSGLQEFNLLRNCLPFRSQVREEGAELFAQGHWGQSRAYGTIEFM